MQEEQADTIEVSASSQGAWGNSLKIVISESKLDADNLFTIKVYDDTALVETLEDLSMDTKNENYISLVKSSYLKLDDISAEDIAANLKRPVFGTFTLSGGADGLEGICDADFIGSATNSTGFYSFDDIVNAIQLAAPGCSSPAVISAGIAYCENRGDLLYIAETPFDLTPQEAVDFRLGNGNYSHAAFVSSYGAMYYPKLKIYDILRQKERYVSPIGDVLGIMAVNDYLANESYVPAGSRRGKILNALGIDVNVGSKGRLSEGNYICENQINPLCVYEDTGTVLWGALTLQRQASLLREVNVRRMLIIIKKTVAAYARAYIHQPNDPRTWREFYRGLEPKFREWKAQRWFYDYRIFCDQN